MPESFSTGQILISIRLGWLLVESTGRMRLWPGAPHRQPGPADKSTQRFTFSDRNPSQYDQLLISLQRLKATAAQLLPELPPPVPDDLAGLLDSARQDMNRSWSDFETWSQGVWNTLQIANPLAGQAFTYGGSLADTYWHARCVGRDELVELLRSQRLESIANRFDSIAEFLPDHAAEVIHHTLYRWRIADRLKEMDDQQKKRLVERLEAQAKVWSDLLFGLQRAEDYLQSDDRRWIAWGSFGATILLVVLVGLVTWLAVLLLSGAGRALLAVATGTPGDLSQIGSGLRTGLQDWQNWSAILAVLSTIVVVLTGFITRLSGWMVVFHHRIRNWLELRQIYKRTLRF